ncbi:MAG: PKD domain-containing protein [Ignavibacteria bacterium]|nr:PKD domain-containing protein [Ignavibacteria bacterium]
MGDGERTRRSIVMLALAASCVYGLLEGCHGDGTISVKIPGDDPPKISSFTNTPVSPRQGEIVVFQIGASDDQGLDSLILQFGDSTLTRFVRRTQKHFSGSATHTYTTTGDFTASLTVYDKHGQTDSRSLSLTVRTVDLLMPFQKRINVRERFYSNQLKVND